MAHIYQITAQQAFLQSGAVDFFLGLSLRTAGSRDRPAATQAITCLADAARRSRAGLTQPPGPSSGLAAQQANWFVANGPAVVRLLNVGLADTMPDEVLPRVADVLGPILFLTGFREQFQASAESCLAELMFQANSPAQGGASASAPGLTQEISGELISGLLGTPDCYTGTGWNMGGLTSLRNSLIGFAHACRTATGGGSGGQAAFVSGALKEAYDN